MFSVLAQSSRQTGANSTGSALDRLKRAKQDYESLFIQAGDVLILPGERPDEFFDQATQEESRLSATVSKAQAVVNEERRYVWRGSEPNSRVLKENMMDPPNRSSSQWSAPQQRQQQPQQQQPLQSSPDVMESTRQRKSSPQVSAAQREIANSVSSLRDSIFKSSPSSGLHRDIVPLLSTANVHTGEYQLEDDLSAEEKTNIIISLQVSLLIVIH